MMRWAGHVVSSGYRTKVLLRKLEGKSYWEEPGEGG
jgi:hypothetical protein